MEPGANKFPDWEYSFSELDQLFSEVSNAGWEVKMAVSEGLWHKYDLPYVGVSSADTRNCKENTFDGYLGMYSYEKDMLEREGRIVLFRNQIKREAQQYSMERSIPFEDCHTDFKKIVLLHELGHWIFHYLRTAESRYNNCYQLYSIELQEAIAQYFVMSGIKGKGYMINIFEWLCDKQSDIYKYKLTCSAEAIRVFRELVISNFPESAKEPLTVKLFKEVINGKRGFIIGKQFGF